MNMKAVRPLAILGCLLLVLSLQAAPARAKVFGGGLNCPGQQGIICVSPDFGGMSTSNDSGSINSALALAASSQAGNDEVYLTGGTWNIGTTINIPASIHLSGTTGTTLQAATTLSGAMLANASGAGNISITNLQINGNRANAASATNCIDFASANDFWLRDVLVHDCKADNIKVNAVNRVVLSGVASYNAVNAGLEATGASSEITVTGSRIYNNGQTSGDGINIGASVAHVTVAATGLYDDQGTPTQRYGATETAPISTTITITAGGSGYTTNPTCAIAAPGGTGTTALCTATQSAGAVNAITVSNAGSGYPTAPSCTISGGGGSGATCTTALGTSTNNTTLTAVALSGNVTAGANLLGANSQNNDNALTNSATAILTNKTIDTAGPNTIKINGNTLAATAGTATVNVPNSADTLVGRATTDTLTNKSIAASEINSGSLVVANGGTGAATLTSNACLVGNGTGVIQQIASGYGYMCNTGAVGLTKAYAALGADVALNATASYFAGPTMSLAAGDWTATCKASLYTMGTSDNMIVRLYNSTGAVVLDSAAATTTAASVVLTESVGATFTLTGTSTVGLYARDASSVNGHISFNQSTDSKDTSCKAVRVA